MKKDELLFFEKQTLKIDDFPTKGLILDIAGGGEGVIAQLKGDQVVAIDKNFQELVVAPSGGSKVQMDATHLLFLDDSFNTVTVFLGFMFMHMKIHEQVLREIHRVLKPSGNLFLWDIDVEKPATTDKQGFAFYLEVQLPDKLIQTGYGFPWPPEAQTSRYYLQMIDRMSFIQIEESQAGSTFTIRAKKPA